MRWLFAFGLVLWCSVEARAQASMDGWFRLGELQMAFERDHAECLEAPQRKPAAMATFDIRNGKAGNVQAAPVPPVGRQPSFTECMRGKGWVKP